MTKGGDFYAVWLEDEGLWSTDEHDALQLIDAELDRYSEEHMSDFNGTVRVLHMWDAESGMIDAWHKYCQRQMRDSFHPLDSKLIFSNTQTKKEDYASKKLSYPLEKGSIEAYDKLMSTLYSEEERQKIEWAIGSIVCGDSKKIQKFIVLYGDVGTGKSTVIKIVQMLFDGYYSVFDAKSLGSANNAFALEAFKSNPLVAIQHDGDLSRIEDNTKLNSVVSHETMTVNEKFKSLYSNEFQCFLFMGTNKPVKITDAKSGIIRRLIDVSPTGNKLSKNEYDIVMKQIKFELGAIAMHCLDIYKNNKNAYDNYTPIKMMGASNDFYNFVEDSYMIFLKEDSTTLKAAWEMYKQYCEDANVPYPYTQRAFKEELKNYFREYSERHTVDNARVRNLYSGFRTEKFGEVKVVKHEPVVELIEFKEQKSIFDKEYSDCLAQYANEQETPTYKWKNVSTKLNDISTDKLHYVKVPENHIVIDFDLKDSEGHKCLELNVKEASKFPKTYAELSKSGQGVHLHYIYEGDPQMLSRVYDENIEIKVFTGDSSLRRKLTKCNDISISKINSGLPLKGEKQLVNFEGVQNEKRIRTQIKKNLHKEYHPSTKSSIDFINKILDEAYESGMKYDISDMRNAILAFAANSTNQSDYCIKLVNKMKFKSEDQSEGVESSEDGLIFYDVEVFPNLFLVNWKFQGDDKEVVRMINPTPSQIEELIRHKLIGFNCRRYDNHILYARLLGYSNQQLFEQSQKIINNSPNCFFGEAYNISYTDVYDFAAKKQSLKKWEIELGILHKELGLPWDQPVPEEMWVKVAEYCDADVIATEKVFEHLKGDWTARQILAELAGMTPNDTTNTLTTRIIFGKEKNPALVYTDLKTGEPSDPRYKRDDIITAFPGYSFANGKNEYRGVDLGFGGYVYAEPGMYNNVALLDIASLHPNSVVAMNTFGKYTQNFKDILDARIAIKHGDYASARDMFNGRLAGYLNDESTAKDLAQALKIAINSVYGLTSANFDNAFRDNRNKNNIVALRGALFMKTLQDEIQNMGFTVAHIKTDSIKIPNATPAVIDFCMKFAKKYGYTFEHEATYERMCLINDAVYIARYATIEQCVSLYGRDYIDSEKDICKENKRHPHEWTATGTQFQVPYVFKKLFSKEPIEFEDLCETKSVTTALYLDMNEALPTVEIFEQLKELRHDNKEKHTKKEIDILEQFKDLTDDEVDEVIAGGHNYHFIGKVGQFCPIKKNYGGGILLRKTDKGYSAANGSKGFRWQESEMVKTLGKQDVIDLEYYNVLVDKAVESLSQFGDVEQFIND